MTKPLIAEFIGTFALILIGAGTVAIGVGGLLGAAFAHGLVILAFAYAYGHISGAHFNPAVTIALWADNEIETVKGLAYIVVQVAAGIAGAAVLAFILGGTSSGLGATTLAPGVSPLQGLVVEIILTFFLVNTIFFAGVSGKGGNLAGLAIGLTLTLAILFGGPLTGGSLNPARTLGPAIVSGNLANIWLYIVGPVVGGLLAALLYRFVMK